MTLQELKSKSSREQMEFIYDNFIEPDPSTIDASIFFQRYNTQYNEVILSLKEFKKTIKNDITKSQDEQTKEFREKIITHMVDFQENYLKFEVGDQARLVRNPLDEQLGSIPLGIKVIKEVKDVSHGQLVKIEEHNDWLGSGWFEKVNNKK